LLENPQVFDDGLLGIKSWPSRWKKLLHENNGERTLDLHEKIWKDLGRNCIKMIGSEASSSI
jgi:hypothetical protein